MDGANLILTEPVSPPAQLEHLDKLKFNGVSKGRKQQIAKDFESVLLYKVLDEMKNTIGDWGSDKDGASKQVHGIFWLCLARDIADNGGVGLWKDIHQFITNTDQSGTEGKTLNGNL